MAKGKQLTEDEIDTLVSYLHEAGNYILSSVKMCRGLISAASEEADQLQGVEALLEKAGYTVDRGLDLLGDPGVVGKFDDWLAGERADEADRDAKRQYGVHVV